MSETPEIREELEDGTSESRAEALSTFKELVKNETNLHFPESDEEFLLRFLRVGKYDEKKAFDRLKRYYKTRLQYRADFDNMKPSGLLPILNLNILGMLPVRDENGCAIMYFKTESWDTSKCSMDDMFNIFAIALEKTIDDTRTQIAGFKLVADLKGFNLSHLSAIRFGVLVKFAKIVSGALPLRVKGMHIVNAPAFYNVLYHTFRMLLPAKLKKRYILHSDLDSLYKYVSREYLPSDVGGSLPAFDNSQFVQELLDWEPTWVKYLSYGNTNAEEPSGK
jgi:hypothetical protein